MHISRRGFTLIELLIVIAIIAIISVVVILTLSPSELLKQSRDANRVSDMATLNESLAIFSEDQSSGSLGTAATTYISIPDPSATSTAGDQCQGLGLPTLPTGDVYHCAASSTYRNTDSTGWIPVNLGSISFKSPLGSLPVDPINQTSSNFFYTYTTNGTQYEVTAVPESQKYRAQFVATAMVTNYPGVIAQGTNLSLSQLWNPNGLAAYWPLDQTSGATAADASSHGYTAALNNSPTWISGKMGSALQFDGGTSYASTSLAWVATSGTILLWANPNSYNNWSSPAGWKLTPSGNGYVLIDEGGSGGTGNWRAVFNVGNTTESDIAMSAGIIENQWNQVVMTWNASGTTYTTFLYVNGVSQGSTTWTGTPVSTGNFAFGTAGQSANNDYAGGVDDVRVYGRPLSAAEVQALYNSEK